MKKKNKKPKGIKKFFANLGPGFITGASDDDPSGIATYSQTGAHFGYNQLWTALFSFPFMATIQETCGRIGLVTGKGLAGVMKKHYSRSILYFSVLILLISNTINIGADLGAMAAAGRLVFGLPFIVWLLGITAVTLFLQVFISYKTYAQFLKYLTLTLLTYIVVAVMVKQDWIQIAWATFVPSFSFSKEYLLNIVAILGTTISPYLFFWQADQEVEEEVSRKEIRSMGVGTPKFKSRELKAIKIDTIIGMFFSNLIMFFIIVTTASTLGLHGITDIQTADQAAMALRPIAGDFAYLLFALGIIGTGLLAVPVLAGSASYALAESFGMKEGLYKKFKQAHGFYGVITVATIVGLLINFTPISPFKMLYYTAVLNGVCAPPFMVIIMLIANNKKIMGKYTNKKWSNWLGWSITGIMSVCAIALIISLF
ncbi:iron transporter [Candidatus Falkowbacteria bacterium CG10_big_fil_rev_8_21_14_0_10_39_11]|uniref:Iron transporter n=1 Tax=Candidatus Falkowbacteria bacterium CG10_big_fil_rev_8_21_14_0_10_39_11 TaxID=1974565 RepID=A0A2H0V5D5_9BACT|nr:MAG: iron transporter [Candidatus Falkowbacteria bacterium CG10_big_fil_rev_8_21_14_0_10_39_11]